MAEMETLYKQTNKWDFFDNLLIEWVLIWPIFGNVRNVSD